MTGEEPGKWEGAGDFKSGLLGDLLDVPPRQGAFGPFRDESPFEPMHPVFHRIRIEIREHHRPRANPQDLVKVLDALIVLIDVVA